ncbi:hypothetical protein AXF42_Ash020830 [Apostasia shenzhenica]|uniref:Uncharacterized protein n=1 Tax=Apostasia shenzhenica TaxID=1088818 RepID=A0A2I0A3C7_9ASPA|nr:hypothetical protein AXF42_Ash020830 [Apostasia shenzhenica]
MMVKCVICDEFNVLYVNPPFFFNCCLLCCSFSCCKKAFADYFRLQVVSWLQIAVNSVCRVSFQAAEFAGMQFLPGLLSFIWPLLGLFIGGCFRLQLPFPFSALVYLVVYLLFLLLAADFDLLWISFHSGLSYNGWFYVWEILLQLFLGAPFIVEALSFQQAAGLGSWLQAFFRLLLARFPAIFSLSEAVVFCWLQSECSFFPFWLQAADGFPAAVHSGRLLSLLAAVSTTGCFQDCYGLHAVLLFAAFFFLVQQAVWMTGPPCTPFVFSQPSFLRREVYCSLELFFWLLFFLLFFSVLADGCLELRTAYFSDGCSSFSYIILAFTPVGFELLICLAGFRAEG